MIKEEKFYTDSGRLYRVTNFYGSKDGASSTMRTATLRSPTSSGRIRSAATVCGTGRGYPWEVMRVIDYCMGKAWDR